VVVKELWHPFVPERSSASFSTWSFVDSLTGIEYVRREAWYGMFQPRHDSKSRAGFEVFYGYCQFCHGIRGVGADYGWDYVDPVPLFQYRGPRVCSSTFATAQRTLPSRV
jgi:hypothetical protein